MIHPQPLTPRRLTEDEIERHVNQDWEIMQDTIHRLQYLSELWDLTTHDATARYLNENGNAEASKPAWESIPDHLWDRQALKLWWEGHSCPEIGKRISQDDGRIRNRLSELRQKYGAGIVPTDAQRRKMAIQRL